MHMLILLFVLEIPGEPFPMPSPCTFRNVAHLAIDPGKACASGVIRSIEISGTRRDLSMTVVYNLDLGGQRIAGTGKDVAAARYSWATWDLWRREYGVRKLTIEYQDVKGRDVCRFTWDHEKSDDVPVVARCVQEV